MSGPVVVADREGGKKRREPEPEPEPRTTKSLDQGDQEEGEDSRDSHADAEGARAHMRCYDNLRGIITSGQQRASATDGGLAWDLGVQCGPRALAKPLVNSPLLSAINLQSAHRLDRSLVIFWGGGG